jgi:hypothetical protein
MPSLDRHWRWLYVIGLLIGVYFGVARPLYGVFGQALIDYFYGVPSQHACDSISWGDISGVVFGPFLVWAIYSGVRGMQRRERHHPVALLGPRRADQAA